MTDISAFPVLTQVLHSDGPTYPFTAGATIKAGQVVAFAATGVSDTVHPAIAGTTAQPIGVAVIPAASGDPVTVALVGSVVTVANATDSSIDAGEAVAASNNPVGGTVTLAVTTATGYVIGVTIEDIAGSGTGKIIVMPQIITKAAS